MEKIVKIILISFLGRNLFKDWKEIKNFKQKLKSFYELRRVKAKKNRKNL